MTLIDAEALAPEGADRTHALDRRHVFHSWSAQDTLDPMVLDRAEGSHVWDGEGRRYLDFSSQLVYTNIGHQHPKVIEAVCREARHLATVAPPYANRARFEAAHLIAERTPGNLDRIFFTNGGADANEHAVRMARLFTGRHKVLTGYRSYHGGTTTAINMTGDPRLWSNDLGVAGIVHFHTPFLYRSVFYSESHEEERERALAHLRTTIELEGPSTIAAVVLESVPGTAGVMVPPAGYLAGVRALCAEFGIMMIADEVMTGFARTGAWFAVGAAGVVPDLLTFAKGVNNGAVPLGGVAISDHIADFFGSRAYPGGLTYSGHPLATAAAVATIGVIADEDVTTRAQRLGAEILGPGLARIGAQHPSVGDVRGLGAMWVIELVADQVTQEPLAPNGGTSEAMVALGAALKSDGLLPLINSNRLYVMPPCTISDGDARQGLEIIDRALAVTDAHVRTAA